jgi:hypothetical protein
MKNINKLITEYCTGEKTSDDIKSEYGETLLELLSMYFNDKNSSTLRQIVSCQIAGLESNPNKLGYDSVGTNDEIKPQNIQIPSKKKLDGGGNYTDLTHKRHQKYIEDDVSIHCSGFVNGQLIFMIKVPYVTIQDHLKSLLNSHLPNGDVKNIYLRSAKFSYKHYKDSKDIVVEFLRNDFYTYKDYINKDLFKFLSDGLQQP